MHVVLAAAEAKTTLYDQASGMAGSLCSSVPLGSFAFLCHSACVSISGAMTRVLGEIVFRAKMGVVPLLVLLLVLVVVGWLVKRDQSFEA